MASKNPTSGVDRGIGGPTDPEKIRVLHVDDSPEFVELSTALLGKERDDFEVSTETEPDEALRRLREEDFDCVISDSRMSEKDIDGVDLHSKVRSEYPELAFVFFTGLPEWDLPVEVLSDEATVHMKKEGGVEKFAVLADRIRDMVG